MSRELNRLTDTLEDAHEQQYDEEAAADLREEVGLPASSRPLRSCVATTAAGQRRAVDRVKAATKLGLLSPEISNARQLEKLQEDAAEEQTRRDQAKARVSAKRKADNQRIVNDRKNKRAKAAEGKRSPHGRKTPFPSPTPSAKEAQELTATLKGSKTLKELGTAARTASTAAVSSSKKPAAAASSESSLARRFSEIFQQQREEDARKKAGQSKN